MKNNFYKGFFIYSVLSLLINLLFMFLLKKQAEYLASDLLHLIPTGIFNALGEVISPSFPDILFLLPIGLTDGIIGGFIGLILGGYPGRKSPKISNFLIIISFAIFEFMDVNFIPLFTP